VDLARDPMAIIESGNSGEFHYDSEPINTLLKMLQGVAQQDNACLRRSKAGGRKKLTVAELAKSFGTRGKSLGDFRYDGRTFPAACVSLKMN
jgi:hypothetical protein